MYDRHKYSVAFCIKKYDVFSIHTIGYKRKFYYEIILFNKARFRIPIKNMEEIYDKNCSK